MHRTLFVDIDGTLVNEPPPSQWGDTLREHMLLAFIRDFAVELGGWQATEATAVIESLMDSRTWWDWQDFLAQLELDARVFWDYADRRSQGLLRPLEPNLDLKLERLTLSGRRLCITSNNPSSGIRHKLRLAGLGRDWQKQHVDRVFGTDVVRAMKWDGVFWREVLALADTPVAGVTVVGNNWNDDVLSPWREGIRRFVFLDSAGVCTEPDPHGAIVHRVSDWSNAVDYLLQSKTGVVALTQAQAMFGKEPR